MEPEMRREINDALNVVENWNSCVEFICYGRKVELQSNDPEIQELTVLAIHLLQNALVLSNTLMVERVLSDGILEHMEEEDFRALTPLFTSNVNPYGDFELNLDKPSFLDAA
jgi:TnpA family transposase